MHLQQVLLARQRAEGGGQGVQLRCMLYAVLSYGVQSSQRSYGMYSSRSLKLS